MIERRFARSDKFNLVSIVDVSYVISQGIAVCTLRPSISIDYDYAVFL